MPTRGVPSGLVTLPILEGATSPVPAEGIGATIWSSSEGCELQWYGSFWGLPGDTEPTFYRTGYYLNDKGSFGTLVMTIGTAFAFPFIVSRKTTITAAQVSVSTAGVASTLRGAIYSSDSGNLPLTLISELGTGSGATVATVTLTPAANIVLNPGVYWVVLVGQGTTAPTVAGKTNVSEYVLPTTAISTTAVLGYSMTGVTGAFPTSWSATITGVAGTPRVWLKVL